MAAVNGVGGDDLRSVVLGKREQRRGERATSEGEEREGARGVVASSGRIGAAVGSRRWRGACSRAAATRVLSSWQEVGGDWQRPMGWASAGSWWGAR